MVTNQNVLNFPISSRCGRSGPGVLRPEAEDVVNLRVEPVARHLQGIVWVPGEHIALADPVDEPLRKVGRNIRPHACVQYHLRAPPAPLLGKGHERLSAYLPLPCLTSSLPYLSEVYHNFVISFSFCLKLPPQLPIRRRFTGADSLQNQLQAGPAGDPEWPYSSIPIPARSRRRTLSRRRLKSSARERGLFLGLNKS